MRALFSFITSVLVTVLGLSLLPNITAAFNVVSSPDVLQS